MSDNGIRLDEWYGKAKAGLPGHEPKFLHGTYDEWYRSSAHMRVSFRGDGRFVIEYDGLSGWNPGLDRDSRPNSTGRKLLKTGVVTGVSKKVPAIRSLSAESCPDVNSGFRAELVLVAEFSSLMAYRGVWTHPKCPGFPSDYVNEIWSFVEVETGGAITRFDTESFGKLMPPPEPIDEPDTAELPCWEGQSWTGSRCVGRPSVCPDGYEALEDGCAACSPGRERVDEQGHCCWPGQRWSESGCEGRPRCGEGFVADGDDECVREPLPAPFLD